MVFMCFAICMSCWSCKVVFTDSSDEAAKGALLYTYKHAACGFSAKLTPKQVEEISSMIRFPFWNSHFNEYIAIAWILYNLMI